jgi:Tol biopolymer transport system component
MVHKKIYLIIVVVFLFRGLTIAQYQNNHNATNYPIGDDCAGVSSDLMLFGAPNDAKISSVDCYFEIEHPRHSDLMIWLTVYDNGWQDHILYQKGELSTTGWLKISLLDLFKWNGLSANQTWYLSAKDCESGEVGEISFFELWVHYDLEQNQGSSLPDIPGYLFYHSYSDYEAWDSDLYMVNLNTKVKTSLSDGWNIDHAMNAHISPDGSSIVFMGDNKGEPRDWDIYKWDIGSELPPQNLTTNNYKRDEDPKFSPDGNNIVFKQDGDIKIMDLSGNIVRHVTSDGYVNEESMPFYTASGERIIYSNGAGKEAGLYIIDVDGNNKEVLVDQSDITEYYPITIDDQSYYFTTWNTDINKHDQIFKGQLDGGSSRITLNTSYSDFSDAYPVDNDFLFFSSTRSGGRGGFDMFLGQISTNTIWYLDEFGINSTREELGACYCPSIATELVQWEGAEYQLFPNPASNFIEITGAFMSRVSIIDCAGKVRLKRDVDDERTVIDVSHLEHGLYFINIYSINGIVTRKIIVSRQV